VSVVGTSAQALALNATPTAQLICRNPHALPSIYDGYLAAIVKTNTNDFTIYRSTDGGGSWGAWNSFTRTGVQELSSFVAPGDGYGYLAYRVFESSLDKIYVRRINITTGTQVQSEFLATSWAATAAGDALSGLDLATALTGTKRFVVVACGLIYGSASGLTLTGGTYGEYTGTFTANAATIITTARSWWSSGTTNRAAPSIDIEHVGDGYSGSTPHLWVAYGKDDVRLVKCAWNGNGWTGPVSPVVLETASVTASLQHRSARWSGTDFVIVTATDADPDMIKLLFRNRANTSTSSSQSPAHPTGVIRTAALSFNDQTRDVRVWAVGTSNATLYWIDYVRATGLWTSWAQLSATALIGTAPNFQFSVRDNSFRSAKHDIITAVATPQQIHTQLGLAYTPNLPTWEYGTTATTPPANGAAMDTTASLTLDWTFSSVDPSAVQNAYILTRKVGALADEYWRTSDSTWQSTEQWNTTATTQVTLTATQAFSDGLATNASDPPHAYKVRVRNTALAETAFSSVLTVVPSTKAVTAITSPTAAQVLTDSFVPVVWTVTPGGDQSKYRLQLRLTSTPGVFLWDSGIVTSSALTATPDYVLVDGGNYTVELTTYNLEGLAATTVTRQFTVDYIEPMTPTLVVSGTAAAGQGAIRVVITNPAPTGGAPALASQDLYRRVVGSGAVGNRVKVGLASGATYDVWRGVKSGVAYEFLARAYGTNGTVRDSAWTP
jgi:hypothetical protein